MRTLFFHLGMYRRLLGIQLRSQMQFNVSFWLDMLSTAMISGVLFVAVALIMQRFGGIAGWSLGEVAFLFGLMEISFGAMDMLFSGFDPDVFCILVREGRFDQLMLRPVGLTWQVLGSRFIIRRIGRIMEGVLIWLYSLSVVDVNWTAAKLAYLPVVVASQMLAMGALFIMGSTITFWTLQNIEAINILTYGGADMMSYPMQIYPAWMRRFFTYIIPFIFLNYYPALYFLDKPDPLNFPAFAHFLAPAAGAGMFLAAILFWRFGIRYYQGSGT